MSETFSIGVSLLAFIPVNSPSRTLAKGVHSEKPILNCIGARCKHLDQQSHADQWETHPAGLEQQQPIHGRLWRARPDPRLVQRKKQDVLLRVILYEQNIHNTRDTTNVNVLTDTARMGIFRYFTGYNPVGWNPNASVLNATFPMTATNASYVAVDVNGNPVAPPFNPDGSPYTGRLVCFSVFGTQRLDANFNMVPFTAADCPGGQIALPSSGTAWDSFRRSADTSGYMKKILTLTPRANYFGSGDGLNIAQHRWQRRREGSNSTQAIIGADLFSLQQQQAIQPENRSQLQHKAQSGRQLQRSTG
jgi:hypothetical protein